ncbi:MAG: molybdopterin oxidoreductase [Gammaproteobacteria bacterium]|nr:MAG: molybdopterin oxidoreductase [Gammaproteobacteria bacterium]
MIETTRFSSLEAKSVQYWVLLMALGLAAVVGYLSSHHMDSHGHYISGMTNQIVWGFPHVIAIFLIVAASGALNVASISSVFGKYDYKPLARLSALLAIALLIGGLAILVLDLGRPDRLIVAMTKYNFKSIFAWNIFLYTGFIIITGFYLWMMMERKMNKFSKTAGLFAFIWRLILTTGTGSIFGFLVARQAYDAAIMAPMFIIMSFAFGMAVFILVLQASYKWSHRNLGDAMLDKLRKLLGIFVAAVFYFVIAYHLTNLYATEHHGVEAFILKDGGIYTYLFWGVHIILGCLIPLALVFIKPMSQCRNCLTIASLLVIIGGLAQLYVIIIGGQAYPLEMFPGHEVSSSFYDGVVAEYAPSIWEILLGIGGTCIALLVVTVGVAILDFLPESLSDKALELNAAKSS